MAFSETDQKRITILALMKVAADVGADDIQTAYNDAVELAGVFEDDGLFDGGGSGNSRSSGRSGRSGGRGSSGRSSSRGSGNRRGNRDRDAWRDDPATDKQIDALFAAGAEDDYSSEEIEGMTKGEASNLLDDLN